jgi:hypothetical protein
MHRSGTSAVAATLGALGIELGDRLIAPHPTDNPRGYFEDAELYQVNLELFEAAGAYWDTLLIEDLEGTDPPVYEQLSQRAVRIVRDRFGTTPRWALKNPRLVRTLPFWRRVAGLAGCSSRFVVSLRHPDSVAASLARRDGIHRMKTLLLWLVHLIPAAEILTREEGVVVNYDDLVDSPLECMGALGERLGIDTRGSSRRLAEHGEEFLRADLRHHRQAWPPEEAAGDELTQLSQALYHALDGRKVTAPPGAAAGDRLATATGAARRYLERHRDWLACLDAETAARWKEIRMREQMIEASGRVLPYLKG